MKLQLTSIKKYLTTGKVLVTVAARNDTAQGNIDASFEVEFTEKEVLNKTFAEIEELSCARCVAFIK